MIAVVTTGRFVRALDPLRLLTLTCVKVWRHSELGYEIIFPSVGMHVW